MVYILNTEIPNKKNVFIGLQYIFGIGKKTSIKICNFFGVSKEKPLISFAPALRNQIVVYIEKNVSINEELKQALNQIKEQQQRLKTYKGQRSKFRLPRRGQRTHTNARTAKKLYK